MRLVIDSNRLIAGLLKDSLAREIILNDSFEFFSPDYILTEIENHKDILIEKSGLNEDNFDIILYALIEKIHLIPFERFEPQFRDSLEIMKNIDAKDTPFLAVGIALKLDGIWTEDKRFQKQNKLKVYRTIDIQRLSYL